jgi:hypothetical protein
MAGALAPYYVQQAFNFALVMQQLKFGFRLKDPEDLATYYEKNLLSQVLRLMSKSESAALVDALVKRLSKSGKAFPSLGKVISDGHANAPSALGVRLRWSDAVIPGTEGISIASVFAQWKQ